MALVPPLTVTISTAADTAVNNAITAIDTQLTALPIADLDADAVHGLNTVDDKRLPYVQRTIEQHAVNYPKIVPVYHSLADATALLGSHKKVKAWIGRTHKELEIMEELAMRMEHNMYQFARDVYDTAKRAEGAGTVPGVGEVIKDIAPLFESMGTVAKGADAPAPDA